MNKRNAPAYVWFNDHGTGRNQFAAFRLSFDLPQVPSQAVLHLFADSAYQLFVNGRFVAFGPVRFDPRFPLHDSIDLAPHFRAGRNVLAVQVKAFGIKTFKAISGHGGMAAWGSISTPDGLAIDLSTAGADWRCVRHESYDEEASKLSFALDAADVFDQAREPRDWKTGDVEETSWPRAIPLTDQSYWGELQPRSIPSLGLAAIPLPKSARVLPLKVEEDVFSFSVLVTSHELNSKDSEIVPYTTWIHSPRDQEVTIARFWGDDSLNGELLGSGYPSESSSLRIHNRVQFRAGWNHYCGWVKTYSDVFAFFLGFPKEAGLTLSPRKILDDPFGFLRGPLISEEEYSRAKIDTGFWEASNCKLPKGHNWIDCPWDKPAQDPCRWTSWDFYGPALETMPCPPENVVFPQSRYPEGFALLLDMGSSNLAFPVLSLKGVEGAIIDVTYSEVLNEDHLHLSHPHHYLQGDRVLCAAR